MGRICKSKSYQNVFTLLGTDGGLLKYLPEGCKVCSAEKSDYIYRQQLQKFKSCKLYLGGASEVLLMRENEFDFIWLDFFGHCMDGGNLAAVIQSFKKLSKGGTLAVTSKNARRKNGINEEFMFRSIGFKLFDKRRYMNNKNSMRLYLLSKN